MVRLGPAEPPMGCFLPTSRQKNANFKMILIMFLFWFRRVENTVVPFKGWKIKLMYYAEASTSREMVR